MSYPEQYIYDKNNWMTGTSSITLKSTGKFPLIADFQWDTYEDLMSFVRDVKSSAIPGMIVSVVSDTPEKNGIYIIDNIGEENGSVHRMLNTEEFENYINKINQSVENLKTLIKETENRLLDELKNHTH